MTTTTPAEPGSPPSGNSAPALIVAAGLTQRYGSKEVLRGIDLQVPEGTIFGFVGPSGSGKTTTVRLLTGIERPSEGRVEVLGRPPSTFRAKDRRRIGYLPQLSVLFPSLSLWQNLSFAASIYGMGWPRRKRLRAVMDLVGLWDDRRTRLRKASGGMQRRLALAAALVHDPQVLFLDEPTAGVDPVLRRTLWERFGALRDEGRTLFVTTQYVGEAAYCDLVAVMRDGRIVTVDTPSGLRWRAFGGELVDVRTEGEMDDDLTARLALLREVKGCEWVSGDRHAARLVVHQADEAVPAVSRWLEEQGVTVRSVEETEPSFDDVFVALIERAA